MARTTTVPTIIDVSSSSGKVTCRKNIEGIRVPVENVELSVEEEEER